MLNIDNLHPDRPVSDLDTLAAAAHSEGIHFNDLEVIRDKSNLTVLLTGSGIVARSPGQVRLVRNEKEFIGRELAVTAFLRDNGLPVVPPLIDHPVEADGMLFSFWHYIEADGDIDAEAVGWSLRDCHEALEDFDASQLKEWGILDESVEILKNNDLELAIDDQDRADAVRLAEEIQNELKTTNSLTPVHGDAHLGNVIHTKGGPVWIDWEDTHLAPAAWDLACLRTSSWFNSQWKRDARIALEAYGPQPDLALIKQARTIEHLAWGSLFAIKRSREEYLQVASGLVSDLVKQRS